MEAIELDKLWSELQKEAAASEKSVSRVYRALGETAVGVRASFLSKEETYELLIEVPINWDKGTDLPEWRGLRFSMLRESLPPRETYQLSLVLMDADARDVFVHFAADLVTSLEGIYDQIVRTELVVECIERWNNFFERCGIIGLSETEQRGLLAELIWLERLLNAGIEPKLAVGAWKGCKRGYYDFDFSGRVVEVKSTIGKEPHRVWINNERQLDDRGLTNLHLFVVTFQITDGGRTLPEVVCTLRQRMGNSAGAKSEFDRCLINAGYLEIHEAKYNNGYTSKTEELFSVREGFPRIVDVPDGVGNLRYCVVLGACQDFKANESEVIKQIKEEGMNA
jgi:hypothetical protein